MTRQRSIAKQKIENGKIAEHSLKSWFKKIKTTSYNKKFELMLRRCAKAYSNSGSVV